MEMVEYRTRRCLHCGETSTLTLPRQGYEAWQGHALLQEAFPNMEAPIREMLISGTHPECWEELFRDED